MTTAPSLNYRVRRGYASDAKVVRKIFLSALDEHGFSAIEANVNREVATFGSGADPAQDDFVVVVGGKVCAFLVLVGKGDGWGELSKVFVARAQRGRGIGSMLIERCLEEARERGYRELFLETNTAFVGARRYYERHGWTLWPFESDTTTRMYSMKVIGSRCARAAVSGVVRRAACEHPPVADPSLGANQLDHACKSGADSPSAPALETPSALVTLSSCFASRVFPLLVLSSILLRGCR